MQNAKNLFTILKAINFKEVNTVSHYFVQDGFDTGKYTTCIDITDIIIPRAGWF